MPQLPTRLRPAFLLALALVAGGCATRAPGPEPACPVSHSIAPRAGSPFAALEESIASRHGEDASGFMLLQRNQDALVWRLAAIDSSRHSLDLQYYLWFGDKVGQLLMARVVAAANRGVKVRIPFDDLNTMLHDMSHVELRDATLARINRHPNIEIRVFNAWQKRGWLGRAAESLWDFQRLNRRMHNKQMVADNRLAIVGGRNVGDEYFGLNEDFNFHDLDVLGVGPVARQASAVFDRYWNSPWVRTVRGAPDPQAETSEPSGADQEALAQLETDARARAILAGKRSWAGELQTLQASLRPGRSAVHADSPSRAEATRNHMPEAFRA